MNYSLYIDENLEKKIKKLNKEIAELIKQHKNEEAEKLRNTPIKVWCRGCTIFPELIDYTLLIHNGKKFISLRVTKEMVGCKLGEFAPTRRFGKHGAAGTH